MTSRAAGTQQMHLRQPLMLAGQPRPQPRALLSRSRSSWELIRPALEPHAAPPRDPPTALEPAPDSALEPTPGPVQKGPQGTRMGPGPMTGPTRRPLQTMPPRQGSQQGMQRHLLRTLCGTTQAMALEPQAAPPRDPPTPLDLTQDRERELPMGPGPMTGHTPRPLRTMPPRLQMQ